MVPEFEIVFVQCAPVLAVPKLLPISFYLSSVAELSDSVCSSKHIEAAAFGKIE